MSDERKRKFGKDTLEVYLITWKHWLTSLKRNWRDDDEKAFQEMMQLIRGEDK